jgi:hypothetical protein
MLCEPNLPLHTLIMRHEGHMHHVQYIPLLTIGAIEWQPFQERARPCGGMLFTQLRHVPIPSQCHTSITTLINAMASWLQ